MSPEIEETEIKKRDKIRLVMSLTLLWCLGATLVIALLLIGASEPGRLAAWVVIASFPVLMSALIWTALFSPQRRNPGEPISDMVWKFQLQRAERSLRKVKARGATSRDVLDGAVGAEWIEKYCLGDRELAEEAFRRVYGDGGALSLGLEDDMGVEEEDRQSNRWDRITPPGTEADKVKEAVRRDRRKVSMSRIRENAASLPIALVILAVRQAEHYITRWRVRFSWIPQSEAETIVSSLDEDGLAEIAERADVKEGEGVRAAALDLRSGEVRPVVFLSEEHERNKAHLVFLVSIGPDSSWSLRKTGARELSEMYYRPSLREMWRHRK